MGNGWGVGNTSLLACWHWSNISPTFTFWQLKYCCWPNLGPTTTHQRWIWGVGPVIAQHLLVDCNRVIFLNIRVILIMQKLYYGICQQNGPTNDCYLGSYMCIADWGSKVFRYLNLLIFTPRTFLLLYFLDWGHLTKVGFIYNYFFYYSSPS